MHSRVFHPKRLYSTVLCAHAFENSAKAVSVSQASCVKVEIMPPHNNQQHTSTTSQHPATPSPPNIPRLRQLIRQYANVCVKRINEWRNRTHRDQQDETNLQWLINERNTWWLLDGLLGMEHRRLQDDAFMSNETFCPNTNNPSRLKYGEDFLAVRNLRTKK